MTQYDYFDCPDLPEKSGIQFIEPLLNLINLGKNEQIVAFVKENYEPDFRDKHSLDTHIDFFIYVRELHGKLTYNSLRTYSSLIILL